MARARNIKPGFFANDVLAECDALARILFAGLWTLADREGRLEDRPLRIKAAVLPYDNCDLGELLSQLAARGFIVRYTVGDQACILIPEFVKHQNPHVKEQASTLPAPCKPGASPVQKRGKTQPKPEVARLNPSSLNPLSLNPDSPIPPSAVPAEVEARHFEAAWSSYPARPGRSKPDALKAWNARIATGADPVAMIAGTVRYAAYCLAENKEPNFIKQPVTFFGPGEHYKDEWTPSPPRSGETPYQRHMREEAEKWSPATARKIPGRDPLTFDMEIPNVLTLGSS